MDEERQQKTRLLKIGVILGMILILAFWFFNLRNVWNLDNNSSLATDQNDWRQIRDGFGQSIKDLQNRLDQISVIQNKAQADANRAFMADLLKNTAALASSTASSTLNVSSTPVVATSSPTSSTAIGKNNPKTKK